MTKEEQVFLKHLSDLQEAAWNRNIVTFSDFCGLNELNIFYSSRADFSSVKTVTSGGYEWKFPILAVNIRPLNAKFADVLTHRDYLGSLMNLGVDRSRIGDIAVMDNSACVFCEEKLAGYLSTELTRVKHTSVVCTVSDPEEISYTPKTEEIGGTVASVRLDSLIALAFHMSRSAVIPLIEGGRTFINGRLSTSNGARLKEGDIISVRGQGRFCLGALEGTTKKGRQFVRLQRYVS